MGDSVSVSTNNHQTNMGQLMPIATTTLVLLVTSASGYDTGSGAIHFPQRTIAMGVANVVNLTSLTGIAGTASVTIRSPIVFPNPKSCPPLYPCRIGNKCCYRRRRPGRRCNYRDCI